MIRRAPLASDEGLAQSMTRSKLHGIMLYFYAALSELAGTPPCLGNARFNSCFPHFPGERVIPPAWKML